MKTFLKTWHEDWKFRVLCGFGAIHVLPLLVWTVMMYRFCPPQISTSALFTVTIVEGSSERILTIPRDPVVEWTALVIGIITLILWARYAYRTWKNAHHAEDHPA